MSGRVRLHGLDLLRGVCLISMILYHGMWNLVYMFGVSAPWYRGLPGTIWQQSICQTFLILSGFCFHFSRNHLKRGLLIFGGGVVVSLVTLILMPQNRILFGILTCTGSCMLLMIPLSKLLRHVPPIPGAAVSFAAFWLLRLEEGNFPSWLCRNYFTAWLGFPPADFWSTDYFPLIPWIFLFILGYFLYRFLHPRGWDEKLFSNGRVPVLNWLGRHALPVYLLHQPVLYGICLALDALGVL